MVMRAATLLDAISLALLALNEGDSVELTDSHTGQSWQDAAILSLRN
jgi:hypothetical protein